MKVKRVGTLTIIEGDPLAIWAAERKHVDKEGILRKIDVASLNSKNTATLRQPYYFDGKLIVMIGGKLKQIVQAVITFGDNYSVFRYFYKEKEE